MKVHIHSNFLVHGRNCNQERIPKERVLRCDWTKYALRNILTNLCSIVSTIRWTYVVIRRERKVFVLSSYNFAFNNFASDTQNDDLCH